MKLWGSRKQQVTERAAKRISTPAGQRLSTILEDGDANRTRDRHRASVRKSGLSAQIADAPRESMEGGSHGSSGYSTSVWSDGEKFAMLRNNRQVAKRGGWKRLLIIIAIILLLIVALAVGLAVGLKKKTSSSKSTTTSAADSAAGATATNGSPSNPTATVLNPSSLPSNFPAGKFSFVTFLDTVQTDCTSNPATWTCPPYTIYNDSPTKSRATFNWIISKTATSKRSSQPNYSISVQTDAFVDANGLSFQNQALQLLDEGKSTERYHFQWDMDRLVTPSTNLTDDNAQVVCEFKDTSLQVALYTKMASTYPDASQGESTSTAYTPWPFAIRIEQTAAGGTSTPSCYKPQDNNANVTAGLEPQDPTTLCSCLYKNWRTES